MSENSAFRTIAVMEEDILAVARWAGVLGYLGIANTQIDSAEIWVISNVLREVGQRLEANWNEAANKARGRS